MKSATLILLVVLVVVVLALAHFMGLFPASIHVNPVNPGGPNQ